MKRWIRENTFVVAALALPLIVVAFFLVATTVPRFFVPEPKYDLWLAVHGDLNPDRDVVLRYRVDDGVLVADAQPLQLHSGSQTLYRFDVITRRLTEVRPDIPEPVRTAVAAAAVTAVPNMPPAPPRGPQAPPPVTFAVTEASGLQFHAGDTAPDGYRFRGRNMHRGLFVELFGLGRNRNFSIVRDGRAIRVDIEPLYQWGVTAHAVGWVRHD